MVWCPPVLYPMRADVIQTLAERGALFAPLCTPKHSDLGVKVSGNKHLQKSRLAAEIVNHAAEVVKTLTHTRVGFEICEVSARNQINA